MAVVHLVTGTTVVSVVTAAGSTLVVAVSAVVRVPDAAVEAKIFVGLIESVIEDGTAVALEPEITQGSPNPNAWFHVVTAVSPYRPEYNQKVSQHRFTTAGSAPQVALPKAVHMCDSIVAISGDAVMDGKARVSDGRKVAVPCMGSYR